MYSLETKVFSLYHLHSFSIQSSGWIIYKGARAFNGCLDWVCLHLFAGGGEKKQTTTHCSLLSGLRKSAVCERFSVIRGTGTLGFEEWNGIAKGRDLIGNSFEFQKKTKQKKKSKIQSQGSSFKNLQINLNFRDFQQAAFSEPDYRKKSHLNLKNVVWFIQMNCLTSRMWCKSRTLLQYNSSFFFSSPSYVHWLKLIRLHSSLHEIQMSEDQGEMKPRLGHKYEFIKSILWPAAAQ